MGRGDGRTDLAGVAGDAVVGPVGLLGDELEDVIERRVRVAAAERLEAPVRLDSGQRRVVRVERRVARVPEVLREPTTQYERIDTVIDVRR